jgi:hypothetical protein
MYATLPKRGSEPGVLGWTIRLSWRNRKRMISLTRRMVLKTAALATTSPAALFVHEGHPARKLSMGFLDRWALGADHATVKPR